TSHNNCFTHGTRGATPPGYCRNISALGRRRLRRERWVREYSRVRHAPPRETSHRAKAPHYDGAHRTIIVSRTERAAQPRRVILATFPRSDGADCDGKGGCANIPECATLPPGKLACAKAPHHDGAHRTIIVSPHGTRGTTPPGYCRNISALGRRRLRRERWVREYSRVRHAPPRETRMR
ncbi:hypothetical protein TcCL_Unassigned02127, partial [Trypanosoma cruzi]